MSSLKLIILRICIVCYPSVINLAKGQFSDLNGKPRVMIPQGVLVGSIRTTVHNVSFVAFEGIPFAKPPIGSLRFKSPVSADKWTGVLDATQKGPLCVQFNLYPVDLPTFPFGVPLGVENCLYLNVYVPVTESKKKLPILVHIHGGGFVSGAPDVANPNTIVEKGIIFIGISYRLGVFGFLSLNNTQVPGNAGLKDVALALKWVRDNAKYFNGDNEQVSVFGESAGAAIAQFLQLSPMTKGSFHKILASSGTSLVGSFIQKNPLSKVASLAKILNLNFNSANFLRDLQGLNAYVLLQAALQVLANDTGSWDDNPFSPVIETKFHKHEAFLTEEPIDLYLAYNFYDVPTLIGCGNKEMSNTSIFPGLREGLDKPHAVVPAAWQKILTEKGTLRVYKEIMDFFFEGQAVDITNHVLAERAIDLYSDRFFVINIDKVVRILAKKSRERLYYYRFSYRGGLNARFNEGSGVQGASHINDIYYLWQLEEIPVDDYSSDGWVRRRIVAMFTNFIKFGDPTPGPCDDLLPTTWLPVSPTQQHYMSIGGDVIPSLDPDIWRLKFWRKLERRVYTGYYN